ncbi:MAG: hypothetical protein QOJ40_2557 [Verrucomicrobiota bacterium]
MRGPPFPESALGTWLPVKKKFEHHVLKNNLRFLIMLGRSVGKDAKQHNL